ncbi:MAG: hypothetical protein PHQ75_08670 [Thermoguttaceae bacterium]|nr:hypothetical protein [Thermoguttaceae bacterium]
MGILDNLFGGASGLALSLHNLLGGQATIRFVSNQTYNEQDDSTLIITTEQTVPFVPEKLENKNYTANDAFLWENVDLVGTVPAAVLNQLPQADTDYIVFESVVYRIVRVAELYTGNTRTVVRIGGKRP